MIIECDRSVQKGLWKLRLRLDCPEKLPDGGHV